jgi:mannosylglycerate hydrolase
MKNKTVHIVSHTHWDPEWYSSFREYQMRLVELIDKLLIILEGEDNYQLFMLDGQVSVLYNYLEIKPENKIRLEQLIKKGKLLIGPFYILPDEYMISPEGIYRNLQTGIRESALFGGHMPLAYLCDMSGHPSQMPQVLNHFYLEAMVGWRGVIGYQETQQSEFYWKAPDGSRILFLTMPFGYINFGRLPNEKEDILGIVKHRIKGLLNFSITDQLLFMEGFDHQEARKDIPEVIQYLNEKISDTEFIHSSLPEYFEAVRKNLPATVAEYSGELRATQTSFVLPGILSTRIPMKKEIRLAEQMLERYAEPMASLADACKVQNYFKEFLNLAWKIQFNNQFHDVIYGAHVDSVTVDAIARSRQVLQVAQRVTNISAHSIIKLLGCPNDYNIVIFNPTPYQINQVIDIPIRLKMKDSLYNYAICDDEGNIVPFNIEKVSSYRNYQTERNQIDYYWEGEDVKEYFLNVDIKSLPSFGTKVYGLVPLKETSLKEKINQYELQINDFLNILPRSKPKTNDYVISDENSMENSSLKMYFNPDGTFNLLQKENGMAYSHLGFIEDSGDRGDQYIYSPPEENVRIYTSYAEIRKTMDSPLKTSFEIIHHLRIPKELIFDRSVRSSEYINQKIHCIYTLRSNSQKIELTTKIYNNALNHRVRIGFNLGKEATYSEAEVFFDVIRRDAESKLDDTFWPEKISPCKPKDRFVFAGNDDHGFLFIDPGWLKEYELNPQGQFYLTLLRCSDYLSVETPPERSVSFTGPQIPTPMSQYVNEIIETEIVIYPLSSHWSKLPSFNFADHFIRPITYCVQGKSQSNSPQQISFLTFSSETIFLSAFKKKEEGNGYILRLWNPLNNSQDVKVNLSDQLSVKKAYLVDGNEKRLNDINLKENQILLHFNSKKIINIELSQGD